MMPVSNEPFMTVPELVSRLRLSESTVRRLVRKKLIPYYRPCGAVRFKWSEVERVVKQSMYAPSRRRKKKKEEP